MTTLSEQLYQPEGTPDDFQRELEREDKPPKWKVGDRVKAPSGWNESTENPWRLAALGFRFHQYANPAAVGWKGWITWGGRCVGFVP